MAPGQRAIDGLIEDAHRDWLAEHDLYIEGLGEQLEAQLRAKPFEERPWLITSQGHHLHLLDPASTVLDLRDVAHASANTCRFLGHTLRYYSVAEHACRVHDLLAAWERPADVCLAGLLHEGGEVGFNDCPTPLKSQPEMTWFRAREKALEAEFFLRLNLKLPRRHRLAVKVADLILLATEKKHMTARPDEAWGIALPDPLRLRWWDRMGWGPARARRAFLARLRRYLPDERGWLLPPKERP